MAVPKNKKSHSKSRMRKGGNGSLKGDLPNVVVDSTSGEFKLPHHISLDGYYNGRKVIENKVKIKSEESSAPQS
jgi:large subunit ribosomal protein L32